MGNELKCFIELENCVLTVASIQTHNQIIQKEIDLNAKVNELQRKERKQILLRNAFLNRKIRWKVRQRNNRRNNRLTHGNSVHMRNYKILIF